MYKRHPMSSKVMNLLQLHTQVDAHQVLAPIATPQIDAYTHPASKTALTLDLLNLIIQKHHIHHKSYFQQHYTRWQNEIERATTHPTVKKAIHSFMHKWIDIMTPSQTKASRQGLQTAFVQHAQQTFQYLSHPTAPSNAFKLFYLILIHTPDLQASQPCMHKLFLRAHHATRKKQTPVNVTNTTDRQPFAYAIIASVCTAVLYHLFFTYV